VVPVVAAPVAAHDGDGIRPSARKLVTGLRPGALFTDHGITVAVPRAGGFVWGELKFADGTWQELTVETATDGNVYVTGRGSERKAVLNDRYETAARGIARPDGGSALAATSTAARGECADTYRNLYPWRIPRLEWRFNPAGTPRYLRDGDGGTKGVRAAISRAQRNITGSDNRCSRGDRVSARGRLIGRTNNSPNVSASARCTGGDGRSVIRFGDLPSYSIAMTCVYGLRRGLAREADIRINGVDTRWALGRRSCSGRELLLEAGMTHEFGHAYGLAHASTYRNPTLTMQPLIRVCSQGHSTLGLGDMLGLERKY
jgi:hypothetical protein